MSDLTSSIPADAQTMAEDVDGHRALHALPTDDDVEGHKKASALPTDSDDSDDDVEGHKKAPRV